MRGSTNGFPPKTCLATDLFMRRKHSKARASRLMLIRSAQRPESDRATAELSEPALKLRLRGVVRQTTHVENLTAFGQKGSYIGSGIKRSGQHVGMFMPWLRFRQQAT